MAERRIPAKQIQRNDTYANWNSKNPILDKGELGVETDTRRFKIGNGVNPWSELEYSTGIADAIHNINTGTSFQLWVGTQTEFSGISESARDENTIYIIK